MENLNIENTNNEIKKLTTETILCKRISKTITGGRRMMLSVYTVVGGITNISDSDSVAIGQVGVGHGKAMFVSEATQKSNNMAKKRMVSIEFDKKYGTIFNIVKGKYGATTVVLFPKKSSSGISVGSSSRTVVKLAGISNISGKIISGKGNKFNVAMATIQALLKQGKMGNNVK